MTRAADLSGPAVARRHRRHQGLPGRHRHHHHRREPQRREAGGGDRRREQGREVRGHGLAVASSAARAAVPRRPAPARSRRFPPRDRVPPAPGQRRLARDHLRPDRAGLHDGLRRPEAHQLRPRRRLHGGGLRRLLPGRSPARGRAAQHHARKAFVVTAGSMARLRAARATLIERFAYRPLRDRPAPRPRSSPPSASRSSSSTGSSSSFQAAPEPSPRRRRPRFFPSDSLVHAVRHRLVVRGGRQPLATTT